MSLKESGASEAGCVGLLTFTGAAFETALILARAGPPSAVVAFIDESAKAAPPSFVAARV